MNLLREARKSSLWLLAAARAFSSLLKMGNSSPGAGVGCCCRGVARSGLRKPVLSSLDVENVSWSKISC